MSYAILNKNIIKITPALFVGLLFSFLTVSSARADLLVHDFSDPNRNSLGGLVSSDFSHTGLGYETMRDSGAETVPGRPGGKFASMVGYLSPSGVARNEYWYEVLPDLDLSQYDTLAFFMRTSVAGATVPIVLKSGAEVNRQAYVYAGDYVAGKDRLDTEWSWVEIPLSAFNRGELDLNEMRINAILIADNSNMSLNGSDSDEENVSGPVWHSTGWTGDVWIDDLWLMERGSCFGPFAALRLSAPEAVLAGGAFPVTYSFEDAHGHPVDCFSGGTFVIEGVPIGENEEREVYLTTSETEEANKFFILEPVGRRYLWTPDTGSFFLELSGQANSSARARSGMITAKDATGWQDEMNFLISLQSSSETPEQERGHVRMIKTMELDHCYGSACAALAFARAGREDSVYLENARQVLAAWRRIQNKDGSWQDLYDIKKGRYVTAARYLGSQSYMVMAVNYYTLITGDTQFVETAERNVDFWIQFQNMDESSDSYGMITAGIHGDGSRVSWVAMENLTEAYSALNNIASLSGISHHTPEWYRERARLVKEFAMRVMFDPAAPRFYTSYTYDHPDEENHGLDAQSWPVLAYGPVVDGDTDITGVLDWSVQNLYAYDTHPFGWGIDGFGWASFEGLDRFRHDIVWGEANGQMAAAFFAAAKSRAGTQGDMNLARYYHDQHARMQHPDGGVAYYSRPYGDNGGPEGNCASTAWRIYNEFDPPFNPYLPPETQD